MSDIRFIKNESLKAKPADEKKLGFGKLFTDYMFLMDYAPDKGWYDPRIVPYGPLSLDPATTSLHYGQEIFEGLKAYRGPQDETLLFRPSDNFRRMSDSAERLCMPRLDEEMAYAGLKELLRIEKDWIPHSPGTSLYIRPTMISTDAFLGVKPSDSYLFFIILSPVGSYYEGGLAPISIWVEDQLVRAAKGGIGSTKAAANYVASLYGAVNASQKGYAQVLWLDALEHKYVEEVGSMNMFFLLDGELCTPPLRGSILPGITRRSIMQLATDMGIKVSERPIAMQELADHAEKGTLQEAFGSGTAAVVSPVGALHWNGRDIAIHGAQIGPVAQKLYDTLVGIQYGQLDDPYGWRVTV